MIFPHFQRLRLFLEGREVTESEVWEEQERRVKELVHIVVTCLPSPNLHHTLTHYPAFTTRVTINFFKVTHDLSWYGQ